MRTWKVSRLQIVLGLIMATAGFLAVTQIRNELLIRQELRVPSQRLEELGFMLREQERTRAAVEQQILQLREQLRAYEQGAAQGRAKLEALTQELEHLRLLAGLTAVTGPGVVVSTGLTCVGTTILCNAKRIAPPYRIVAIGDPAAMLASLQRPDGVLRVLRAFGFPVKVTAPSRLAAPAYRGGFRFTYAQPAESEP